MFAFRNNPGNAQGSSGGGVNNETSRAVREPKERDRKDRGAARISGEAAPVEDAPAEPRPRLKAICRRTPRVSRQSTRSRRRSRSRSPAGGGASHAAIAKYWHGYGNRDAVAAALAGLAAMVFGAMGLRRRLSD